LSRIFRELCGVDSTGPSFGREVPSPEIDPDDPVRGALKPGLKSGPLLHLFFRYDRIVVLVSRDADAEEDQVGFATVVNLVLVVWRYDNAVARSHG
jgi:hypothetical protein